MIFVGFIGPHSSRKTTLVYEVAAALKKKDIDVDIILEQWRKAFYRGMAINKKMTVAMQWFITAQQIKNETELRQLGKADVVLCDRTVLDTIPYMYTKLKETERFRLSRAILSYYNQFPYDIVFYCDPMELKKDRVRDTDPQWRSEVTEMFKMLDQILAGKSHYYRLAADLKDRAESVLFILGEHYAALR